MANLSRFLTGVSENLLEPCSLVEEVSDIPEIPALEAETTLLSSQLVSDDGLPF